MSIFLGIDLGTSYFKAGVFDETGILTGLGRQRVSYVTGAGNRRELLVPDFWETLHQCVRDALREAGTAPEEITALAYSSQANSFILLDRSDNALTPLISWTDGRADPLSPALMGLIERSDFINRTGLGLPPGKNSMIAKIDWFQKNEPHIWANVRTCMSMPGYLTYNLTGEKVSDVSTSSMTGLFDVQKGQWWSEATDLFNIKIDQLFANLRIGTKVGHLTEKGSELIGLSPRTVLFSGGLDHHMVAIGAGLPCMDGLSESTGTVLACVGYQKGYHPREGVNTAPGLDDTHFFRMAFGHNGALALEWYQKNFAQQTSIQELLEQAEMVEPGSCGLIALPCSHKFPGLSGFQRVTKDHQHAHFVRAILESTAASLAGLVRKLDENNLSKAVVPSGGGAKSQLWIRIKANLLDKPFLYPVSGELACKGAALMCAMETSGYKSIQEAMEDQIHFRETIFPHPLQVKKYAEWKKNNNLV